MSTPADPVSLADWRRSVAELYAGVRAAGDGGAEAAAVDFRARRDRMFREHIDSPIRKERRAAWRSAWYPYDPAWRVVGVVRPLPSTSTFEIALSADGVVRCSRVGIVEFMQHGVAATLFLYWFEGYGGGLWLPFADDGNGNATYGGGRYLYDTIKGADLGATSTRFVLDFNFAYNPSCAYDDRWSCPLAPSENRLAFEVSAGERVTQA